MALVTNESRHRWLGRAVGLGLLATFGAAMYQNMALGDDVMNAAANNGSNALSSTLNARMLLDGAMVLLTVFVAAGFYFLLRPISGSLSLIASAFRLAAAGFTAYGVFIASGVISNISNLPAITDAQTLLTTIEELNALNFDLFHWGLIASSVGAAINYALLFAGRFIPRAIAGYGVLASIGATIGASAIYLSPPLSNLMFPAYVAANALAFISLTLWLIAFGVNTKHWNARALSAARP